MSMKLLWPYYANVGCYLKNIFFTTIDIFVYKPLPTNMICLFVTTLSERE